ncbi:phosphodiester glycosidase family protein [Oceanobacillus senegalensis]|uniref:phosphodiester glycosidase family protein n=1 Tax=Oceanobacillus senegalensis TaxID=1936063 RepID=UPI0015C42C7A|nr:phosphodiester glycosidase family protein [Oceanobacillus senegalensis]
MKGRIKIIHKKSFMVFLAFILVMSNFGGLSSQQMVQAKSSNLSIGEVVHESQTMISPGVEQTRLSVEANQKPLQIYQMNIDPSNPYVEMDAVSSHGKLTGFQTLTEQAKQISKPGHEVVGGINGDYFSTATGIPTEAVIHDGRIMRSNANRSVVGVLESGEVKIAPLCMQIEMSINPSAEKAHVSQVTSDKSKEKASQEPDEEVLKAETDQDTSQNSEEVHTKGETNQDTSQDSEEIDTKAEANQDTSEDSEEVDHQVETTEETSEESEEVDPQQEITEETSEEPEETDSQKEIEKEASQQTEEVNPQTDTTEDTPEQSEQENPNVEETQEVSQKSEKTNLQAKIASAHVASGPIQITSINRTRHANDLVIYSADYDSSTHTNSYGTEVILENVSGVLKPTGNVSAVVKEVRSGKGNTNLTEGQLVLSGHGTSRGILDSLSPGDQITIETKTQAPFENVEEAIGGKQIVVKNGEAVVFSDSSVHPRTAVGIKEDGTVILMVIDGRQSGFSEGVSLTDLGRMMKDQGAVTAINLDGGGSSTFAARQPGDSQISVINSPSGNGQRNISNTLLIVSTAPKGELSQLTVSPQNAKILAGSHATFSVKGQDQYYHPAEITEPITWSAESDLGAFKDDGEFQAGTKAQTGDIVASTGSVSGAVPVEVVTTMERMELGQTELSLGRGESHKINVKAYHHGTPIIADDDAFTYEVIGDIGSIDEHGQFTAVNGTASGRIKVSYGDLVEEIKVEVGKPPMIIEDFEDGLSGWTKSGARYNSIDISLASDPAFVQSGEHSLRLDYDFTGQKGTSGAYALPSEDIVLEGYPEKIGLWVYGANDGHWLRAQLRDGNGNAFPIDFTDDQTGVNWNGWKYVEASIPKGKATPLKVDLAFRVMETDNSNKNAATVYIDNMQAIYGESNTDETKPPENGNDGELKPIEKEVITSFVIKLWMAMRPGF